VLANDTDPDPGTTLTAVLAAGPANGALALNPNGSFTYTPNANFSGSDSFTYRANDGIANSNLATVAITVNPIVPPPPSPIGPIYTQGASYRITQPAQPLGPIYTQGASYRIAQPAQPLGPVYTQGASYRIAALPIPLSPIYTQGASYFVLGSTCAANVTAQVSVARGGFQFNRTTSRYVQSVNLTNSGTSALAGPIALVLDGLSGNTTLFNRTATTVCAAPTGSPYIQVSAGSDNLFSPGEAVTITLEFTNPANQSITYSPRVLAGADTR
jgi:hypothetical protein